MHLSATPPPTSLSTAHRQPEGPWAPSLIPASTAYPTPLACAGAPSPPTPAASPFPPRKDCLLDVVSMLVGHHGYSTAGLAETIAQHSSDPGSVQAVVENILVTHADSWGTRLPGLPAPWQQVDFTTADRADEAIPSSNAPDSPIAKYLDYWQLNHACGHYLQALTPDTRNINGSFRAFAENVAAASDQLLGKEELTDRVKRARKKRGGNLQWGSFCSLLRLKRDPDRHCAQTLLHFLTALDGD